MKVRDVVVWPRYWTNPRGDEVHYAPVDSGILVDIREWEDTLSIVLVVRCRSGKYYGIISTDTKHYDAVVQVFSASRNRILREIKNAEINLTQAVS